MFKLSPSILSADFVNIGNSIKILENENVDYIHIDVMDGVFVNNISMGMPIIKSLRKYTRLKFDTHLMITKPERYIEQFVQCGCDIINIHYEACNDIINTLKKIRSFNKSPAITINPKTDCKDIIRYLDYVDMVLIMSVEPGFGGQKFIQNSLSKIQLLADYISRNNFNIDIEIDGGININNVKDVINAGANVIVVGSAIFSKSDVSIEIRNYYKIFEQLQKLKTKNYEALSHIC